MKPLDPLIALAFGDKTFSLKLVAHRVSRELLSDYSQPISLIGRNRQRIICLFPQD